MRYFLILLLALLATGISLNEPVVQEENQPYEDPPGYHEDISFKDYYLCEGGYCARKKKTD